MVARYDGLAGFAFAIRGLGVGALPLLGADAWKWAWLSETHAGTAPAGRDADAVPGRAGPAVIDKAVQIHGGGGVREGHGIEWLDREIRPLRVCEGA